MTTAERPEVSEDDFREILAQTRHFVRTAVVPREQEILTEDRVPDDLRDQAKKMGLFGYAIPQRWGGLGLNLMQDVELAMELGYTSLALRSMFGTNNGIAGQVLVSFGTDEVVMIDLGEADQLAPGSQAIIYRDNPVPGTPRLLLGELAVLTTGPHWASAKIIRSSGQMHVGDRVELK